MAETNTQTITDDAAAVIEEANACIDAAVDEPAQTPSQEEVAQTAPLQDAVEPDGDAAQSDAPEQEAAAAKGATPEDSGASKPDVPADAPVSGGFSADAAKETWARYYRSHRYEVIYTIVGVVVAVCILQFGFWPMLLVVLCAYAGMTYGRYRDGDVRVVRFIKTHFGG